MQRDRLGQRGTPDLPDLRRPGPGVSVPGLHPDGHRLPDLRRTGLHPGRPVPECRGIGRIQKEKTVAVRIPAGVDTGSRLRLRNEGEAGRLGGPPGDLYVVIHVKAHEFFERDGEHVFCRIPVSLVDAALGAEIEVPTLHGEKMLKIPKGVQSGDVLKFNHEGFPNLRGFGKGDQVMEIQVKTPTKLSKRQEELLREFSEIEKSKRDKKTWTQRASDRVKEALNG